MLHTATSSPTASTSARLTDHQVADRLWADYARTRDPRTREAIVHQFERLAYSLANRFARRDGQNEDLMQVSLLGLVKAVDRFDPATHNRFISFATPTILGEIRHYFRDQTRAVHVTRGAQELCQRVTRGRRELTERLGRVPTSAELGRHLELSEERVNEALSLERTQHTVSLESEVTRNADGGGTLESCLGTEDAALGDVERRVGLRQAMQRLSEPLRQVIHLRYIEELSQREVAQQLGISQMTVCRMERRALDVLRRQLA